jgi:putative membrane protein
MSLHPVDLGLPSGPPGGLSEPAHWLTAWTWDPLVLGALIISATLYTVGATRLWTHAGAGRGVRPWQAIAHGAGVTIIALALISPLDRASDVLFSAHMAQHELLMLIAAPLIVFGRPVVPMLWSLPHDARIQLMRTARRPLLARTWHLLTAPVVALGLHALVRWLWHVPRVFDAALADERLHAVQHLTFFATALLFWWTLLHGRYGRTGYGVGVAFVFFTMIHSGFLAALLSLAPHPLYAHGARTAAWGIDAVADQQRAGLVMWVPAGIIMMALGLALLAAWLGQSERRTQREESP